MVHLIILVCKWTPLKTVQKRVKKIILRTIGLLIKCQSFSDMHLLLSSLFIVLINETDGNDKETGIETICEKHKTYLTCNVNWTCRFRRNAETKVQCEFFIYTI